MRINSRTNCFTFSIFIYCLLNENIKCFCWAFAAPTPTKNISWLSQPNDLFTTLLPCKLPQTALTVCLCPTPSFSLVLPPALSFALAHWKLNAENSIKRRLVSVLAYMQGTSRAEPSRADWPSRSITWSAVAEASSAILEDALKLANFRVVSSVGKGQSSVAQVLPTRAPKSTQHFFSSSTVSVTRCAGVSACVCVCACILIFVMNY